MVVIRINGKKELVNSRPCYNCLNMMKAVGIRKVYYSVDNNIVCERVDRMVSIGSSSIMRHLDMLMYHAPKDINEYYLSLLSKNILHEMRIKNIEYF